MWITISFCNNICQPVNCSQVFIFVNKSGVTTPCIGANTLKGGQNENNVFFHYSPNFILLYWCSNISEKQYESIKYLRNAVKLSINMHSINLTFCAFLLRMNCFSLKSYYFNTVSDFDYNRKFQWQL